MPPVSPWTTTERDFAHMVISSAADRLREIADGMDLPPEQARDSATEAARIGVMLTRHLAGQIFGLDLVSDAAARIQRLNRPAADALEQAHDHPAQQDVTDYYDHAMEVAAELAGDTMAAALLRNVDLPDERADLLAASTAMLMGLTLYGTAITERLEQLWRQNDDGLDA